MTRQTNNPMGEPDARMMAPRPWVLGRVLLLLLVVACFGGALYLVFRKGQETGGTGPGSAPQGTNAQPAAGGQPQPNVPPGARRVTLGIAYGTEKQSWFESAAREFMNTPEGRDVDVRLMGMGSLGAAQKVWDKDQSIHVWSPASAMYKDVFVTEWQAKYGTNPILREEPLALTPMVFVMWEDRYQPFVQKYGEVSFRTIAQAMGEDGGWRAIAAQPEWGHFKFSHTHPNKSNSGLATLLLMAHDYFGKSKGLGGGELTQPEFQKYLRTIENGAVTQLGQFVDSTGNLMVDMVRFGRSRFDCIFVYESTAIDRLSQAQGRWGDLRVVYPKYNMWNENPYYVLDVPWSSREQREAANRFLAFLLSEPVQKRALDHGFRPANTAVFTNGPDSPLVRFQSYGLRADLPGTMCDPPRAEVISGLLNRWQQIRQ